MAAREIEALGVSVEAEEDALEDFDVLEAIAELQDGTLGGSEKLSAMVRLLKTLLGGEQYARAKKELREKNGGRLGVDEVAKFLTELINALDAKN